MNILVCLKMVSRSTFTDAIIQDDVSDDRLSGGINEINPADAYALEKALRLKDRYGANVTVLTMSPMSAEPILRTALGMGADRAVIVSDRCFAGADTIATAQTLASALKHLPMQDLVICGSKAIDSETGHIGPQLSVLTDLPCMSSVLSVKEIKDGAVYVIRAGRHGEECYSVRLPALITIINGTEMVRTPTIMGLRRGMKAEIDVLTCKELGLDPMQVGKNASGTETIKVEHLRFAHRHGTLVSDVQEGIEKLSELLEGEI